MSVSAIDTGTWERPNLERAVAVVTGSTRGIGRGIAEVLGRCGATVYVTGRSTREKPTSVNGWYEPEWSVEAAADAVTQLGGNGIAAQCDHSDDTQVAALFDRVRRERGRMDILVNNAIGSDLSTAEIFRYQFSPVWMKSPEYWDQNMNTGLRAAFVACRYGLPLMLGGPGLVVFTSEFPNAEPTHPDPVYDLRAHATSRMAVTFAKQLAPQKVSVLSVVPGDPETHTRARLVREQSAPRGTESVHLTGRAVAALAADPDVASLTGQTVRVAELATRYRFTDTAWAAHATEG